MGDIGKYLVVRCATLVYYFNTRILSLKRNKLSLWCSGFVVNVKETFLTCLCACFRLTARPGTYHCELSNSYLAVVDKKNDNFQLNILVQYGPVFE